MATVVRAVIPASEFALNEALIGAPETVFECERIVENEGIVVSLTWVRGTDRETLETELERDGSVGRFELLDAFDEEYLYQIELNEQIQLLLHILTNTNATILDATGNNRRWLLRIMYPDRNELSQTGDFCDRYGLSFDIQRIRALSGTPTRRYNLTDEQFDALTIACKEGYFDVPRGVDLDELADELGITHQALSERLRRGHEVLIEETLLARSSQSES
jgi:predicted DNA binding protein